MMIIHYYLLYNFVAYFFPLVFGHFLVLHNNNWRNEKNLVLILTVCLWRRFLSSDLHNPCDKYNLSLTIPTIVTRREVMEQNYKFNIYIIFIIRGCFGPHVYLSDFVKVYRFIFYQQYQKLYLSKFWCLWLYKIWIYIYVGVKNDYWRRHINRKL